MYIYIHLYNTDDHRCMLFGFPLGLLSKPTWHAGFQISDGHVARL